MDTRTLYTIIFVCIATALYAVGNRNWNLLTISIVIAFCSGAALYFKLISGNLL